VQQYWQRELEREYINSDQYANLINGTSTFLYDHLWYSINDIIFGITFPIRYLPDEAA